MEVKNYFWITCALDSTLDLLGLVLHTLVVPWLALFLHSKKSCIEIPQQAGPFAGSLRVLLLPRQSTDM